jgi:hypothetical protein
LFLEVKSENVMSAKFVSMMGSYFSLPLTSSWVTQTKFPVLISDFNQQIRFMITDWGNSIENVHVNLCFTVSCGCWGTYTLTPTSPIFTVQFTGAQFGFMEVKMYTSSSRQGFVGYQIF